MSEFISIRIPRPGPLCLDEAVEPYELMTLVRVKKSLNAAKSRLDPYNSRSKVDECFKKTWMRFRAIQDTYRGLKKRVATEFGAKNVSNAWLKYWELYNEYKLIPSGPLLAFFNAELPGAALCAFMYYTEMYGIPADWRASSLIEDTSDSTALGDTYDLYEKYRDKWLMGPTNNGDSTLLDNIDDFAKKLGDGVDLYSHDAGIDVGDDFNIQEQLNAKLHLGCALAGFMTMKPGANFIAKQYTFFETLTWNLIIIYASMFEEFYICKPVTSRDYNSEVYLVGKNYLGGDLSVLRRRLRDFNERPIIPNGSLYSIEPSISAIERAARIIFGRQTRVLIDNTELFKSYFRNLRELDKKTRQSKEELIEKWIQRYMPKK